MIDDDWISGSDLVEAASAIFPTTQEFKDWLILRLGTGRVVARARSTLLRRRGSSPAQRIENLIFPPRAWTYISLAEQTPRRIVLSDDLEQLSGPALPPSIEGRPFPPQPFESHGISYERAGLRSLLGPTSLQPARRSSRAGIGGKPADSKRWAEFAAAFAVIAEKNGINPRANSSTVYEEIAQFLTDADLSPLHGDTVRDAITMAQAWIEGIGLKR